MLPAESGLRAEAKQESIGPTKGQGDPFKQRPQQVLRSECAVREWEVKDSNGVSVTEGRVTTWDSMELCLNGTAWSALSCVNEFPLSV